MVRIHPWPQKDISLKTELELTYLLTYSINTSENENEKRRI